MLWNALQVSRTGPLWEKGVCQFVITHPQWVPPDRPLAFLDHVTREKLDRILAIIQGSHQKALVM